MSEANSIAPEMAVVEKARRAWPGGAYSIRQRSIYDNLGGLHSESASLMIVGGGVAIKTLEAETLAELFALIPEPEVKDE